jgi:hypothetical protein
MLSMGEYVASSLLTGLTSCPKADFPDDRMLMRVIGTPIFAGLSWQVQFKRVDALGIARQV